MDGGDDRRVKINFSSDGVGKLRVAVKEKLDEFLGDYTDDTLVEYVIVLLKNGRRKEEAKNELDVFLGDDTDSFITWLWDHLASSLHLYSQSVSVQSDDVGSVKPDVQPPVGKMESESEEGRSTKLSKTRHRRQWKGLVKDEEKHQILKSSVVQSDPLKEESHGKVNKHQSLKNSIVQSDPFKEASHGKVNSMKSRNSRRKRFCTEAREPNKVLSTSVACASNKKDRLQQASMSAPRRLLQFAVRDALATTISSISVTAPSLKRLRSVVSPASEDTTHDERLDIEAVSEAAEDVRRIDFDDQYVRDIEDRYVNDFEDRYVSDFEYQPHDKVDVHFSYHGNFEDQYVSDMTLMPRDTEMVPESGFEYDRYNDMEEFQEDRYVQPHDKINFHSSYHNAFEEQYASDMTLLPRDTEIVPESGFAYDGYNDVEDFTKDKYLQPSYHNDFEEQYVSDIPLFPRGTKMINEFGFEYDGYSDLEIRGRGSKDVSLSSEVVRKKVEDSLMLPYDVANNTDGRSQKGFSSVSVKDASLEIVTWKSPQYREPKENMKLDSNMSKAENKALSVKIQSLTNGPYSTGQPTDDADSGTIFVGNVHFAATKDGLSRHFKKFGEVLKVNILSDPATGLPKGSAYVEFIRKEAAEHALSLDGTSFMSRILKVLKGSAAPPEGSSTLPRPARHFPYHISGFSMIPFPRGAPNVYRARPRKPGAKSFQWKRDVRSIRNPISNHSINTSRPVAPRGLTYIRADPKRNRSSNNS